MTAIQNFKVQLTPGVTLTETDGKLVLFSKRTGDFFGLNDSANLFLDELSRSDFLTTQRRAVDTYNMSPSEISADLLTLVEDLEDQKLIVRIPIP